MLNETLRMVSPFTVKTAAKLATISATQCSLTSSRFLYWVGSTPNVSDTTACPQSDFRTLSTTFVTE